MAHPIVNALFVARSALSDILYAKADGLELSEAAYFAKHTRRALAIVNGMEMQATATNLRDYVPHVCAKPRMQSAALSDAERIALQFAPSHRVRIIKSYRDRTGCSLHDAVAAIDAATAQLAIGNKE